MVLLFALSLALAPQGLSIGANLEGIADWSYSNVFADLVKQARGFGSLDRPWEGQAKVDSGGWPTEDFGVVLATWPGQSHVGGTYKIRFKCHTAPTIKALAGPGVISHETRDSASGLVTADLEYPETGPGLMLSFTHTDGGVKDLQVLRPGCAPDQVFTQPFLDHCARFAAFRFMDFESTNGNPVQHWSERTPVSAPSWSGPAKAQVPWEICLQLCNRLKKDAWINVPVAADDDYVKQLARLIHHTLAPGLHVYVEYSNEVWNWGFSQATWNKNQAVADVKAGDADLNFDNINDPNQFAARRIAKRIKQISDLFRAEYGAGWNQTVRPVLATQVSWPDFWLRSGLTFLNARYGPPEKYLYACAGAPYFNMGEADKKTDLSKDQVLTALRASVEQQASDTTLDACATLSRYYNLAFLGYESGPDTFGPNNVAAKKAASLDPAMEEICETYGRTWFGYGFGLVNWFVGGASNYDSPYGTWGLTNDMANQTAPKILAIDALRKESKPVLNQGSLIPGEVDIRRYGFRDAKWQSTSVAKVSLKDWRGPYRDYLLRCDKGARLAVHLSVSTDQGGGGIELWVDNKLVKTLPVPNSRGQTVDLSPVPIDFPTGLSVLRIVQTGSGTIQLAKLTIGG